METRSCSLFSGNVKMTMSDAYRDATDRSYEGNQSVQVMQVTMNDIVAFGTQNTLQVVGIAQRLRMRHASVNLASKLFDFFFQR